MIARRSLLHPLEAPIRSCECAFQVKLNGSFCADRNDASAREDGLRNTQPPKAARRVAVFKRSGIHARRHS